MTPTRTRARLLALTAAIALLGCSGNAGTTASAPEKKTAGLVATPTTKPKPKTGPDGPYAVGVKKETFVDRGRPTKANHSAPARPDRTLETVVVYPAKGAPGPKDVADAPPATDDGPFPLIVFSHGFTANGPAYEPMYRAWAAAGYVVAAPTFPLSNGAAAGGPNLLDYKQQPGDVSFVIDEVLRLSADRTSDLAGLVDPSRIGAAGHSLGAITTLGLTYNSCCREARVKAAVPMSGIELPFDNGSFQFPATPLLLIHGDADRTVPYKWSQAAFADAKAPKFLMTLPGAPHSFMFGPLAEVTNRAVIDFFDRYLKDRADGLERLATDGRVPGRATLQEVPR